MPIVVLTAKDLTDAERNVINERTLLVLTKGAQPLSSLGSALSAIARQPHESGGTKMIEASKRLDRMPKILVGRRQRNEPGHAVAPAVRNGFEVVIAVNGQEGVDMADSEKPDLILMDMSLPVMDGWEATRTAQGRSGDRGHSRSSR